MAYWALKTRRDKDGTQNKLEEHWQDFLNNKVIAIGWGKIKVSPPKMPERQEIITALENSEYDSIKQVNHVALVIDNFLHLTNHDFILLCNGYSSNKGDKVRIYGKAKVINCGWEKATIGKDEKAWECFSHRAEIKATKKEKEYISKKELIYMLSKGLIQGKSPEVGSFEGTLKEITKEGFDSVVKWAFAESPQGE